MFPSKMKKLYIAYLYEDNEKILKKLEDLGTVHLINVSDTKLAEEHKLSFVPSKQRSKLLELVSRIENLQSIFNIVQEKKPDFIEEEYEKIPTKIKATEEIIKEAEEYLNHLEKEVIPLYEKLEVVKKEKTDLELFEQAVKYLKYFDLNPYDLFGYKNIFVIFGLIDSKDLERLKTHLEKLKNVLLFEKDVEKERKLLLIISHKENENEVKRLIRMYKFEELIIPEKYKNVSLKDANDIINKEREKLSKEEKDILNKLKELYEKNKKEFLRISEEVYVEKYLDENLTKLGEYSKIVVLTGWVPEKDLKKTVNELKSVANVVVYVEEPEKHEKIPTLTRNPKVVDRFELLTKMYGVPNSKEFDPTLTLSLTFPTIYALMYGDLGHGLLLTLIGYIIAFKTRFISLIRRLGFIVFLCGLFSIFTGGLLYGKFFGISLHEIGYDAPLSFIKFEFEKLSVKTISESIMTIVLISFIIGIIHIIVGCIINMINKIRHGDIMHAIFNPWGLMGLIFYGTSIILVAKHKTNLQGMISDPLVFLVIAPLIILPIGLRIVERQPIGWSLFEVILMIMKFLSNTISYVRIAAFVILHAALSIMVLLIIGSIPSTLIGYILKAIIFVLGNIAIFAIEGFMVFVQTLRLHYYEYFSKFYEGDGYEFKPLKYIRKYTYLKR